MSERCHTFKGVHIPGCMGCAVYGHSGCTCERAPRQSVESRYRDALSAIAAMGCAGKSVDAYMLRDAIGIARKALLPNAKKRQPADGLPGEVEG